MVDVAEILRQVHIITGQLARSLAVQGDEGASSVMSTTDDETLLEILLQHVALDVGRATNRVQHKYTIAIVTGTRRYPLTPDVKSIQAALYRARANGKVELPTPEQVLKIADFGKVIRQEQQGVFAIHDAWLLLGWTPVYEADLDLYVSLNTAMPYQWPMDPATSSREIDTGMPQEFTPILVAGLIYRWLQTNGRFDHATPYLRQYTALLKDARSDHRRVKRSRRKPAWF